MTNSQSPNDCMDKENKMLSLTSYLSSMRNVIFRRTLNSTTLSTPSDNGSLTLVLGNPSADLDSFVSALTLSYFYNLRGNTGSSSKTLYVPILNLPAVRANDLWRLRPEFGVAARLATGGSLDRISQGSDVSEYSMTEILERLITIADIKSDKDSGLCSYFKDATESKAQLSSTDEKQNLFLTDHNSPSIPGLSDDAINSRFEVVGCIDHHVDENYVAQEANPRIITTGIGSCTSLVVKHLRDLGMWPSPAQAKAGEWSTSRLQEIAKFALAPILIDTWNLKATGDKCSDTDREVVKFLESLLTHDSGVQQSSPRSPEQTPWDRDTFHCIIATAKANSLSLLTMQETFDRDYKAWHEPTKSSPTDSSSASNKVNIGISSLVKPLSWLIKHAGGIEKFLDEIAAFATADERKLGVYSLLTRAGDGKEVVILAFDERMKGLLDEFESKAGELQLAPWNEDEDLIKALRRRFEGSPNRKGNWRIWWMGDTSKSRKQVGPLLRGAARNA
ncbi:uncharacterized protein Z518_00740 [Rhinocladiella mackenziei CBS 650.93]|uniref:DHHA2 domain-containing protein n=1 Tax=Rhinocladiella mackenziei CBS 650.93 TaxID=1442369 RepID=A0A0D2IUC1_9EURO|nr:uncharacterized protein Z518_00740 [Rhinocladiella mackenziei CBS 650.93]KIX09659.1 hypothetical protein Z518_00740 [Rhinocladiella mackenziei CBS 650.93]